MTPLSCRRPPRDPMDPMDPRDPKTRTLCTLASHRTTRATNDRLERAIGMLLDEMSDAVSCSACWYYA